MDSANPSRLQTNDLSDPLPLGASRTLDLAIQWHLSAFKLNYSLGLIEHVWLQQQQQTEGDDILRTESGLNSGPRVPEFIRPGHVSLDEAQVNTVDGDAGSK